MYVAITPDEMESVVDFADTLKELCQRLGISYENCKNDLHQKFRIKGHKDISSVFIKKVPLEDD